MPRITRHLWYCAFNHRNVAADRECTTCHAKYNQPTAQVRAADRAVVFYNERTGEHRTPARADSAMPASYAAQGFERKEITSMTSWEKQSGVVHEATNFHPGNEIDPCRDPIRPKLKPEVLKDLATDMAAAIASGPWTGGLG